METVKRLLSPKAQDVKRLLISDNKRLRSHLQNVPGDVHRMEDCPAPAALAYATHTLLATTPWLEYTEPQRYEPTIEDGFESVNLGPWGDTDSWAWDDDDEAAGHDDGSLNSIIE